jgi:para-nitrobenzyl esterase
MTAAPGGAVSVAEFAQKTAVVSAPAGPITGRSSGEIVRYLGIPYAQPPVGDLRWRAPQPLPPWREVFDAQAFGPAPRQIALPGGPPIPQSEDCLTINVWRPAQPSGGPLPVMVWIYGGGFSSGASQIPIYDGGNLARKGVVVVSFNYRVGRLGFFAHPALSRAAPKGEALANFGLMDQIAALGWVRDNIASFGGDPQNVTIFGESAGGTSVAMMLGAPPAAPLFHKAIVQSTGNWPVTPMRDASPSVVVSGEARGARFGRLHGCGDNDLTALRALPFEALIVDAGFYDNWPMVDGEIIPLDPIAAWAGGDIAHKPVMIGCTSWEGGVFAQDEQRSGPLLAQIGSALPSVMEGYPEYAGKNPAFLRLKIAGDILLTMPSRWMAQQASRNASTWHYSFDYLQEANRAALPGVPHGGELPFVFKTLDQEFYSWKPAPVSPADRSMAEVISDYWVSFAKTGQPEAAAGPQWSKFMSDDQQTMVFGADGAHLQKDFQRARLDRLQALLM